MNDAFDQTSACVRQISQIKFWDRDSLMVSEVFKWVEQRGWIEGRQFLIHLAPTMRQKRARILNTRCRAQAV